MPLSADTLLDRMYLKAQLNRWRIAAVVFAVLALCILFADFDKSPKAIGTDYIARLNFSGIILDDQDRYQLIEDLGNNNRIKAVILWLDTPGGSAVGGEETYLRIRELAAKKPVVAVMRSVAASAGYMIALGADRIYAREGTITGSIGVIIESAEITELAEKIGIKPIIIKSDELKGTLSPFEKTSPEEISVVKKVIDDFYNRFVDIVAAGRKLPRDQVVKLADGRIYSGHDALSYQLIDAIGGERDAVAWLENERKIPKNLNIIDEEVRKPMNFLEKLTEGSFGKFFQNSRIKLDGLSAIWHPDLQ